MVNKILRLELHEDMPNLCELEKTYLSNQLDVNEVAELPRDFIFTLINLYNDNLDKDILKTFRYYITINRSFPEKEQRKYFLGEQMSPELQELWFSFLEGWVDSKESK